MVKRSVLIVSLAAAIAVGAIAFLGLPIFQPAQDGSERVVLLHGLGRSAVAMVVLENYLAGAGFEVHNIEYPSPAR